MTHESTALGHHRPAAKLGAIPTSLIAITIGLIAVVATAQDPPPSRVHALILNGGARAQINYLSHLHHVEEMTEVLRERGLAPGDIDVFSADGTDPAPDLARRDSLPADFWLLEGTRLGQLLRPRTELVDSGWKEGEAAPATSAALEDWFQKAGQHLETGDRFLLFVTDHGEGNEEQPDNGSISLWQEELTVDDLDALLGRLPAGVTTTMVMSQCYSGTFARLAWGDGAAEPDGRSCGFFSTRRDLRAYGCYPEGRDRDRLGHAFQFVEALGRRQSAADAHTEVLVTDDSPDIPLRTSDLYLERLLEKEAELRGTELDALADELLAIAWEDRARWEPEIRLLDRLGEAFGTFSPRTLSELDTYAARVPPMIEQLDTYAERWDATLVSVKGELLRDFLEAKPEWRERLSDEALQGLTPDTKASVLAELLPALDAHARGRRDLWQRLSLLRDRAERSSEAQWRMEVRRAALERMRTVLRSVAGRTLIEQAAPGSRLREGAVALRELERCEALVPGSLPNERLTSSTPSVEPYPPLANEVATLEDVLPAWLGVRFASAPDSVLAERSLGPGATFLRVVYPESPASAAGLQAGDIVLGPAGEHFTAAGQLREWTMISPMEVPLELDVLRPSSDPARDQTLRVSLVLKPFPMEWPELPGPPQVGERAPSLPEDLVPVGDVAPPAMAGREHLLFFWATWCVPCKRAVPEVKAYAASRGMPVVAISDEDLARIGGYIEARTEPFFDAVFSDPLRGSFIAHGVSGTPTIVVIGDDGVVRHRQVGYSLDDGLEVDGWQWSGGSSR